MASILISAQDYREGIKIAQKTARALGSDYVGQPFLSTITNKFKIPEDKISRALGNVPSARILPDKSLDQTLACVQSAVLERLKDNNLVCEGLAAHLYVREVSHVLTVRLLSDTRTCIDRIAAHKNISEKKAAKLLERRESKRTQWSLKAFSLDETDPSLYDMVLNLDHIGPKKAIEVIEDMAQYRKFKPMSYSRKCLRDLGLAAELRVALLKKFPNIRVVADGGTVAVYTVCSKRQKAKTAGEIKVIANQISGIKFVEVHALAKLPSRDEIINSQRSS